MLEALEHFNFTSATTGEPKMIILTQASYGLGHRLTGGLWRDLKPDEVRGQIVKAFMVL